MRRQPEQQHGLVTPEQAPASGMKSNQIGARLRRGAWERVARTVDRVAGSVPT